MLLDTGLIMIGLIMLYFGGDFLVSGSTHLAKYFNLSPFIIGATIIGFGTSAPELAVSVFAALQNHGEIALGNIIGSNIANIGLVLGLTAFVAPLTIEEQRLKEEAPSLIIASLIIVALAWDHHLNRIEGSVLIILLFFFLWRSFSKKELPNIKLEEDQKFLLNSGLAIQASLIIGGLVMLVVGANWMIDGAIGIARGVGISEWFIGVTIVAVGTSLPELASTMIAAKRGHGEMAIGNVFGSNVFNILLVMGAATSIHPLTIKEYIHPDLIYSTLLTFVLLMFIRRGEPLTKRKGIFLIACYIIYIVMNGSVIL